MPPSTSRQQQSARSPAPTQQASVPQAVPFSRLGISQQDAATLQQHQQLALTSQGSARSPTGSQASSQGRLLLDPTSLTLLGRHFDRVMGAIQQRLEQLNDATERAMQQQYDRAGNAIEMADAEIARFRNILHQIDELETEFDKIRRIREIVRGFRARVEELERRIG
ncbi:hypothetical protein K431DRAFT_302811 [Polychaeton citri CBS 116435]|uniref:Biogenesis of lysosome-related organelles complex 1 subunit CNL1 n=1 Tax=Polychaeton citri CBS 116435 TaxID=1314669 RepID=A0A9P4UR50_9PEZI|nr:hypothetical protein K431DRAFT_302811 [Polychaeton citri CBS 116435]